MENYWNNRFKFKIDNNRDKIFDFINTNLISRDEITYTQIDNGSAFGFDIDKHMIISADTSSIEFNETYSIAIEESIIRFKDNSIEILFRSYEYVPKLWFKKILEKANQASVSLMIESFFPENNTYAVSKLQDEMEIQTDIDLETWVNNLDNDADDYLLLACYKDDDELEHRVDFEATEEFDSLVNKYKRENVF